MSIKYQQMLEREQAVIDGLKAKGFEFYEPPKPEDEIGEILRSLHEVCLRKGEQTNWEALTNKVKNIIETYQPPNNATKEFIRQANEWLQEKNELKAENERLRGLVFKANNNL